MELQQIQLAYQPDEDRILYRASFKAADDTLQEIRAWLTRRLTMRLWEGMMRALTQQVALDRPQAAHASADLIGMEHQASVMSMRESGGFDTPYQARPQAYPLGEIPILVTSASLATAPNQPMRINFAQADGHGFEVAFTTPILHGFCELLKDAVAKADWGIDIMLPGAAFAATPKLIN